MDAQQQQQQQIQDMMNHLSVQQHAEASHPSLNKASSEPALSHSSTLTHDLLSAYQKRSQRFTVQRVNHSDDAPVPKLPPFLPPQQQQPHTRDFNPVVGSMPSLSPSSEVLAPASPNSVSPSPGTAATNTTTTSANSVPTPLSSQSSVQPQLLPGQEDTSDEVIPNALVLKNVSFNTNEDEMLLMMDALGLVKPYAFNFHYDLPPSPNLPPVFRGLAFANFRQPEEATAALAALNGYDVHGRKLKVEYKRQLRVGEKEKIEREKALKRMRSAQSLRAAASPGEPNPRAPDHPLNSQPPVPPLPQGYAHSHEFMMHPNLSVPAYNHYSVVGGGRLSPPGAYPSDGLHHTNFDPSQQQQQQQQQQMAAFSTSSKTAASVNSSPMLQPRSLSGGQRRTSQNSNSKMTELDMNDAQTLEIYSRVLLFKDDSLRDELSFSKTLSAHQRRIVHLVAQKLGLGHRSAGEGSERYAVVFKPTASSPPSSLETDSRRSASSNLRGKKSMPNMRGTPDFSQLGLPPMGSLGMGVSGHANRMLSGRKSQGDLRSRSSTHNVASTPLPPLPTQLWLSGQQTGAPPGEVQLVTGSPTGTSSSAGSVSSSFPGATQSTSLPQQQPIGTSRSGRSTSSSASQSGASRGAVGRAEQSSDWRRGTLPSSQPPSSKERSASNGGAPASQTAASLDF